MTSISLVGLLFLAAASPWQPGSEVGDGWRVVSLRRHAEFVRYTLSKGGDKTVVEVTYRRSKDRHWVAGRYRIQPAPGYSPRYKLLTALRAQLKRWHQERVRADPRAPPLVKRVASAKDFAARGSSRFQVVAVTLVVLVLLSLLGFIFRAALTRWTQRPVRAWLALSALLNPRAASFGPDFVGRRDRWTLLLSVAVALLCSGVLLMVAPPPPVEADTCIDLALARDCHGVGFRFMGNSSSFLSLRHGAQWSLFLAACDGLGLGADGLHLLVTLLHGLAVGGLVWLLLGYLRQGTALLAGALFFLLSVSFVEYPKLWNPTLVPVLLILHFGALLALLHRGKTWAALLAAASLALVVDAHMVHVLLAPVYLLAVALRARRPWFVAALGALAFTVVLAVPSHGSHVMNLRVLSTHWVVLPAAVGLLGAFAAGLLLRPHLASLAPVALHFQLLALAVVSVLLLLGVGLRGLTGTGVRAYHLLPLLPFAVVYLARLAAVLPTSAPLRHVVMLAAWIGVAHVAQGQWAQLSEKRGYWRLRDTERLAAVLYGDGYSYRTLASRLRGPRHNHLVMCLASLEPSGNMSGGKLLEGRVLYALWLRHAPHLVGRPGVRIVTLGGGERAALFKLSSWLRPADPEASDAPPSPARSFYARTQHRMRDGAPVRRTFKVHPQGPDRARRLTFVDPASPWSIVGVAGVSYRGALPGRRVVLLNDGSGPGTITLVSGRLDTLVDAPPDYVELPCGPGITPCLE